MRSTCSVRTLALAAMTLIAATAPASVAAANPLPIHLANDSAVISVAHGSATGRCVLDPIFGDPSQPGTCIFSSGTGTLTQFHLSAAVTTIDFVTWYWDGLYTMGVGD